MALLTEIKKDIEQKVASSVSEDLLAKFVVLNENVEKGKKTYLEKCMPCHGDQGQGIIGPNLTDDFWIHGGKLMDIRQVILKGVLDKGMVPWEAVLKENEVQELVAFIYSLRGTNPANPKAAEGVEVNNE
jgi:cytochrome c oxidase cbb3-type subunit 3